MYIHRQCKKTFPQIPTSKDMLTHQLIVLVH